MNSFARVVQCYTYYRGGPSDEEFRRGVSIEARGDLSYLFTCRNWRAFEKYVDYILWGTESVTLAAIATGATVIRLSTGAIKARWKGQDIVLSDYPYLISGFDSTTGIVISPEYNGSALASGSTATIRQVRIGLPDGFGSTLGPVLRGTNVSVPASQEDLRRAMRLAIVGPPRIHAVIGNNLVLWPPADGHLSFSYRYTPDNLFYYQDGTATVATTAMRKVAGTNTKWTRMPTGQDLVIEEQDNINRGMPVSNDVSNVVGDDDIRLKSDWIGTTGSAFRYSVSTKLGLPQHMGRVVEVMARQRARKAAREDVSVAILDATDVDQGIDESELNTRSRWSPSIQPAVTYWN